MKLDAPQCILGKMVSHSLWLGLQSREDLKAKPVKTTAPSWQCECLSSFLPLLSIDFLFLPLRRRWTASPHGIYSSLCTPNRSVRWPIVRLENSNSQKAELKLSLRTLREGVYVSVSQGERARVSECECGLGWWPLRSGQRLRLWRSKKRNNVRRFRLRLGGGGAGRKRKVIRPGPGL